MAALNMTAFQAALKEMYPINRVQNLVFKNNPLFAMMKKNANVGGEHWKIPVQYADIGGRSATFSDAQAQKVASQKVAFNMTAVQDYAIASVEGKVWRASQGDSKAFLTAARSELDSAFNAMRRSLGIGIYRTNYRPIGTNTSAATGTTITLTNREEVTNFEVNQELVFATANTAALKAGSVTVTAINRGTGVLTVDALTAIATGAGIAANDLIYLKGDRPTAGSATGTAVSVSGLLEWLPTTAPSAGDSHFGVDRSSDTVRLAGNIVSATGLSVEEALIRACTEIGLMGGTPTHAFMPFLLWEQLGLELGSKKEYTTDTIAGVGFTGFKIIGPEGAVKVYADRNCPAGNAFVLDLSTWTYYSIGPCPGILDLDNVGSFLRESTADAYELRVGCYPQVGCSHPGANAVITNLPTS